ncbi:MAG: DUF1850 domain-containing protein [Planctomycetota bacterium]
MRGRRLAFWWAGGACGCGLAAILIVGLLPGGLELVVSPKAGGEALLRVPIQPGEHFTLRYIHSVDRTPIWDEHSVDREGCIYLEEERFIKFGAGMGHWPGHGVLTSRGPFQVIERIHAPLGEFVLRVGACEVNHTIIWRGRAFNLSRLVAGRAVVVSAQSVSPWRRLWRVPDMRGLIIDCHE